MEGQFLEKLLMDKDWEELATRARFQPEIMAALCGISLRHLERFFAREFKMTPGRWGRLVRCRLACKLIAQGWSNKAVVVELNYWDGPHLCREVKHFFGVRPQRFAPVPEIGLDRVAEVLAGPPSPEAGKPASLKMRRSQ